MKERNLQTRIDETYPFKKFDEENGNFIELLNEPPIFDVKFLYSKGKRGLPTFKVFAQRIDSSTEQYEI